MTLEPLSILLAEDDPGHATLVRKNLRRAGIANEIHHVTDGQSALDFIHSVGPYADRPVGGPLLLLLDIKMPRLDGVEVLRTIKSDVRTQRLPVVILTTTDDPREVQHCYELGCNIYITKPVDHERFVEAVRRLGLFLSVMICPPEEARR